jgi:hypothetical protein
MNRLAPRLVQPLVRGTFTRNVTQTRNLASKTNLLRPVVKPSLSRNLAPFLIMLPVFFISADVMTLFLVGEFSGLYMMQFYQGTIAIGVMAIMILEGSIAMMCVFHS